VGFGLGLLLGVLIAVGGLATVVAPPASQAADPAPAGVAGGQPDQPRVAVVRPGDTLWSVAARHLPSQDPVGMIEEIRRLNRLPDHTIHPGQELILPDRR
jgi:LysM repeat protein